MAFVVHSADICDLQSQSLYLIQRNSYFLIEWLRALAVDTGSLDDLAVREFPRGFFPGGVAEVLTRRLSRVPAQAAPLLCLAAVAGRKLDLGLLRSLWPQLDALMQSAVEAGVLEAHGVEWRFSHDKLRERILTGLDTDSRRALHLQVASGLVAIYPGDHSHAAAIAHHYEEAQQEGLAAHHYVLAGEAAFNRGAPSEAEGHFAKAVALNELLGTERRVRIKAWSGLSQARYALGKLKETVDALQPMFALAGAPLPDGQLQIGIDLVAQLYQLLATRVGSAWRGRPAAVQEEDREILDTMRQALASQEVFVWMVRPDLFALCNVRSLYLEAALATPPAERHLSSWVLFMFGVPQLRPLVKRWLRLDPRRLEFTGWPTVNFYRQAAMLWLNLGDGSAAAQAAEQAVTLAQAMRDDHALILSLFQLQLAQIALEDFTKVLSISQELAQLASRLQNQRYLTIGLLGQAMAWMRFGEFARATPTLERARLAVPSEFGVMPQAMVVGQSALCALRLGDHNKAERLAGEAMAVIDQIKWAILPMTHALTHVLEVYLTIANARDYVGAMEKLIAHLAEIARRFPYASPRALLYRGRYELWRNNPRRARLYLQRSLRAAQDVHLSYEEAQAQEWLGRLASQMQGRFTRGPDPVEHLHAALTYYQRTGARWELARLRRDFPRLS